MRRLLVLAALCAPAARGGLTVDDQAVDVVTNAYGSCTRFYGQGGHVGCATQNGADGVEGDLFGVLEQADITGLQQSLSTGVRRAVVVWQNLLTAATMDALLANAARVAGVLIIQSTSDPSGAVPAAFSPAAPGVDKFNAGGFDWLSKSFPFPISLIQESQAAPLVEKVHANRRADSTKAVLPIHKATFTSYMGPSLDGRMNSTTCIEWITINGQKSPKCVPIGGQSVWAWRDRISTAAATPAPTPKPVVLAVAQMDARSLLYGHMPGADGAASGLVALLAAAEALKTAPTDTTKTIAYAAFQGESWEHLGSRAFVDDVNQFDCIIKTNQTQAFGPTPCLKPLVASTTFQRLKASGDAPIETVVGVDQVGANAGGALRMHYADATSKTAATKSGVPTATSAGIPASSPASTFADYGGGGGGAPAPNRLVLGRYDGDFSAAQNPYFGSHLDTADRVVAESVTEAANELAQALYKLAGGAPNTFAPAVSKSRVSALLSCITAVEEGYPIKGWSCAEMDTAVSQQLDNLPFKNAKGERNAKHISSFERPAVTLQPSAVPRKNMDLYTSTLFAAGSWWPRLPLLMPIVSDADGTREILNFYPANATEEQKVWLGSNSTRTVLVWPNRLEIFVYALLANATGSTADDPRTWYHNAISRALVLPEKGTYPNYDFTVDRSASAQQQATLWAEPYWTAPTVTMFVDGGSAIAWIALVSGLVIGLLGVVGAKLTLSFLAKEHVL